MTANGKVVGSPRWSGSDKYSAIAYPTLSFARPGEQREWESPDDSVSYGIPLNDIVSVGPVISIWSRPDRACPISVARSKAPK